MSESPSQSSAAAGSPVSLSTARLVGFSGRDTELLRQFLKRPMGANTTLEVVDATDADLLIANLSQPEAVMAVRRFRQPGRTIGLVQQFASDAAYYQVQQNAQLLYSLAQGINRLREGWYPPHLSVKPADDAKIDAASNDVHATTAHASDRASDAASAAASPSEAPQADAAPNEASAEPPRPSSARSEASLPWQRKLSIIVIDDSKFSRVAIQEALGKVGFSVETAVDGEEGLRMAAAKVYDVALVDFEMPGIKGPEVIRRLRALGVNTPQLLIMLTSRTGAVDRLRAKLAGCDAYLTKPTKMSEFVSVLSEFASQGRLKRG